MRGSERGKRGSSTADMFDACVSLWRRRRRTKGEGDGIEGAGSLAARVRIRGWMACKDMGLRWSGLGLERPWSLFSLKT